MSEKPPCYEEEATVLRWRNHRVTRKKPPWYEEEVTWPLILPKKHFFISATARGDRWRPVTPRPRHLPCVQHARLRLSTASCCRSRRFASVVPCISHWLRLQLMLTSVGSFRRFSCVTRPLSPDTPNCCRTQTSCYWPRWLGTYTPISQRQRSTYTDIFQNIATMQKVMVTYREAFAKLYNASAINKSLWSFSTLYRILTSHRM